MVRTTQALSLSLETLRRELHQIPEVGLHLPETHVRLLEEFSRLPVEIFEAESTSGFAALLRGEAPEVATDGERTVVLLRADMDALPIREETGLEFAARNGNMHACGHDLHMAAIVGAARSLADRRHQLRGDVVFLLQPGEEGFGGAEHVIEEGLLDVAGKRPDHAYGLHVWSSTYEKDAIVSRGGALMSASEALEVRVLGRGGHGSAPQHTIDPVPILCEMVLEAQVMVARQFDVFDPVVVTCGSMHAGSACNVIPDDARASFSIRTFSSAARKQVHEALNRLFSHLAEARGATCELSFERSTPLTFNSESEVDFVESVVEKQLPGRWSRLENPVAASEDFSHVLNQIPGAFVFVSAVPAGVDAATAPANHSPQAVFDDAVVNDAAHLLIELAATRLSA